MTIMGTVRTAMSSAPYKQFTLTGNTKVIPMTGAPIPATVSIAFASLSTQKIEYDPDGLGEYFLAPYAASSATKLVASFGASVSAIKITGVAGNVVTVL
jgi:hypothetical protein